MVVSDNLVCTRKGMEDFARRTSSGGVRGWVGVPYIVYGREEVARVVGFTATNPQMKSRVTSDRKNEPGRFGRSKVILLIQPRKDTQPNYILTQAVTFMHHVFSRR